MANIQILRRKDSLDSDILWTSRCKTFRRWVQQWQKAGLPIDKQVNTAIKKIHPTNDDKVSINFIAKINPLSRADAQIIKEKQNDPNVVIVDARTPKSTFKQEFQD